MKQVRETAAAKALQVFVILRNGLIEATVHVHYSKYGVCTVDVWGKTSLEFQGKASGYGFDKFTSAITGAIIGGIPITDHCSGGNKIPFPEGEKIYPIGFEPPKGYFLANGVEGGFSSCYRESGLDVLKHYDMIVEKVL